MVVQPTSFRNTLIALTSDVYDDVVVYNNNNINIYNIYVYKCDKTFARMCS